MKPRAPFVVGFRVSIALVLVVTITIMAVATTAIVINIGADSSQKSAQTLFTRIAETIGERTDAQFEDTISLARYAALDAHSTDPVNGFGLDHPFLSFLKGALDATPTLYSVYVGGTDGTFFQVIQTLGDPRILEAHKAPAGTKYVVRTITGTGAARTQHWSFVGDKDALLGQRTDAEFDYVPSARPWFQLAVNKSSVVLSDPYIFNSLQEPGITASVLLPGGKKVLGVDLTTRGLQAFIDQQDVSPHGGVMLLDAKKAVMAKSANFERHPGWLTKNVAHVLAGQNLEIVLTAPMSDFDGDFQRMQLTVILATLVLVLLILPLTMLFTKRLTRMMTVLSEDVDRVCKMDFSGESPSGSSVREFDNLARGFGSMKSTLATETKVLGVAQLKLKKIVETGIALSTEKNTEALLQKILDTAMDLTEADGGTLYQVNPEGNKLDFKVMVTKSTNFRRGGTHGDPPPFSVPLFKENGEENHHNVATHAFLSGEPLNIPDVYNDLQFDFSGTKAFDKNNNYKTDSILTVPLKPLGADVLGALQLINAKAEDGVTSIPFAKDMQDFVEALAASAATAIYNKQLVENLEHLFDAIIDVINGAIGRKSPYTGGHCDRVPLIAIDLARVTSEVKEGPLAGFEMNKNQLKEFELASKLHDVGKVTTPEYVVDKSTKLETIYNRIHEVRSRFEILYRDAVIQRYETVLASAGKPDKKVLEAAEAQLAATKLQLEEEWSFIAKTNLGGEFLSPDKVEMVKTIASRTWLRYFDDRLGLSWEEEERIKESPVLPLPVQEKLLDDKAIHKFPRRKAFADEYTVKDKNGKVKYTYQFKTPVPELLYNQGEIYNLAIGRGTLTVEEHFKIKEHVMQSIFMLDQLPWPKGQENVSLIAGEHHETLIGSGYPYQKKAEDLSMQSRILTIADIFEALTASDRPYKKPKSLSESVKVLYFFKKDRHIDGELFDLFLTSGVYKTYAEKYMRPEQLDEVDISQYLGPIPASPAPAGH